MLSLGYSEYVTQGGDWGHVVRLPALPPLLMRPNSSTTFQLTRFMAFQYGPQHVKASHTNFPRFSAFTPSRFCVVLTYDRSPSAAPISFWKNPIQYVKHLTTPYTPREREGLALYKSFHTQGHGYYAVQSTRPQTLGYSLADSPVGMLAWIYEKLVQWTDSYPWTDEEGVYLYLILSVARSSHFCSDNG